MKHLFKFYIVRVYLAIRYFFHWATGTGSFGPGQARHITPSAELFNAQTLQGGLLRHHVKQYHESSCSVASVVAVVNVLRERYGRCGPAVTQQAILEKVRTAHWKERMGPDGYNGRRGLPLAVLRDVVQDSLEAYGVPFKRVEMIKGELGPGKARVRQLILGDLKKFQALDNCLIIAHFDQGTFIKEMNIPHISPVGGFDPASGLVTILDVDPDQHQAYNIPFDRFYKGISTGYAGVFRPFGYDRGGVVVIHLA